MFWCLRGSVNTHRISGIYDTFLLALGAWEKAVGPSYVLPHELKVCPGRCEIYISSAPSATSARALTFVVGENVGAIYQGYHARGGGCTQFVHGRSRLTIDPSIRTICRDGARRVFTSQEDIARTKPDAPWGFGPVAWGGGGRHLFVAARLDFFYDWSRMPFETQQQLSCTPGNRDAPNGRPRYGEGVLVSPP